MKFSELKMAFEYKDRIVTLRGTHKSTLQWMQGTKMPQPAAELSSMMFCVYPVARLSMIHAEENIQVLAITELIKEYANVFAVLTSLPPERAYDHKFVLKEGVVPVNVRPYRHPPTQKDVIKSMAREILETGVIREKPLYTLQRSVSCSRQHTLFAKHSKCVFVAEKVEYLGHIITKEEVSPDTSKIEAMKQWPTPTTIKQLRVFLGTHREALQQSIDWGYMLLEKMRQDVKTFMALCEVCQQNKSDLATYPGLLQPLPVPNLIWTDISMDFIEGLPLSHGKSVILVVVDRLTKYSLFIALSHPFTATQVVNVFMDHVYKLHGLLKTITVYGVYPVLAKVFMDHVYKLHEPLLPTPRSLSAREAMVQLLKFHLHRAQQKMKAQADKRRTDRVFEVDHWVYLKLQSHKQVNVRQGKYHKLTPKYNGPFKIIAKVGQVAYKLLLPATSQIHPMFYISQLKLYKGPIPNAIATLPVCNSQGELIQQPVKVLDRRLGKVGNSAAVYVLIQWSNSYVNNATW
ncbi:retrotransposable element Tf2 [Tanacetum coccineum]